MESYDEASETIEAMEDPESIDSLEIRARLALETGEMGDARQLAKRLRTVGQLGAGWLIEAESLLLEGKLAKSEARFEEASAILGNGVLIRAAELFRETGHTEAGSAILRKWVEREPSNPDAHFSLGAYFERWGRHESAEAELLEAISLHPEHAQALNYLGYSLADRAVRLEYAHELIERALALDPWNGAYLDSQGWVLFRMGRYEEARAPLERAAREYPRDATVQEHLGDLYERLGMLDDAVQAWRMALTNECEDEGRLRTKIGRHSSGAENRSDPGSDAPPEPAR
jgi:tetratricopeptide (TPR) repeat protein